MSNYVVKISRPELLNQIYWKRIYSSKLRRDWTEGSKIIFITKIESSEEAFVGLGKVKMIYELSALDIDERKFYVKSNYSSKIVFGTMVRFLPAIVTHRMKLQSLRKTEYPLLDGVNISDSEVSMVEDIAKISIIN
ncbi:MAG TPA: hypothetical protein VJ729_18055 [Nitrososphaeraceae archaeon]|nr:hypothetical protein [Nitrososphaeraceae archaeon]